MTVTPVDPAAIDSAVAEEMARLRAEGKLEIRVDHRCRVCEDDTVRRLVNKMLTSGMSHRMVFLFINDSINPARKKADKRPITQRIIKHHDQNHLDFEAPARRVWRQLTQKRAAELGKDIENGIHSIVTPLAYMDVTMQRGFEDLIDPDTKVEHTAGAAAARFLAEWEHKTKGEQEHAEMMAQLNTIIGAVKDTVPPEMWDTIVAKVKGEREAAEVIKPRQISARDDDDDDGDDDYDPTADEDFDDEDYDADQ